MTSLAELHLKPVLRERYGLPDIGYPLPIDRLVAALANDGAIDFAELLFWLQQHSGVAGREFRQYEPAMARLAELIAPEDDARDLVTVMGDEWWLELGPVDLDAEIVTIQRDDELVVAIAPREDGRLRTAVFRPLDATSASKLIALSQNPHPEGGVCMRDNNWEYAKDAAAGMGQAYAAEEGAAYLSYWQYGIGILHDRTPSAVFRPHRMLTPRRPAVVAIELGIHYQLDSTRQTPGGSRLG